VHEFVVFNNYVIANFFIPLFNTVEAVSRISGKEARTGDNWNAGKLGRCNKTKTINAHGVILNKHNVTNTLPLLGEIMYHIHLLLRRKKEENTFVNITLEWLFITHCEEAMFPSQ